MDIAYTTDNNFIPQVCACICSVCETNRSSEALRFHVLGKDLTKQSVDTLSSFVNTYSREIYFYDISDFGSFFGFDFDTSGWNPIVLARLLIDKILPDSVSRVIYLDGDTVVRGDIEPFFNTELGDCSIAGVIEPTVNRKNLDAIAIGSSPYINAGVLLIDLDKWRLEGTGDRIIDFYREHDGKLFANDQDAINGALKGQICFVSPAYNYCNAFDFYPYKSLVKIAKPVNYPDFVSEEMLEQAKRDPKIIHYLGEERPWRTGNRHRFKSDYEKHLSITPYNDAPPENGWQTYFRLFYLFNAIMKLSPVLRHRIISTLIPLFMKHRKKQLVKEKKSNG